MATKQCSRCREVKDHSQYSPCTYAADGLRYACKECEATKAREARERRRAERIASDYEALNVEDFDVTVGNDGRVDPQAAKEKRQEYSRSMGDHANALHSAAIKTAAGSDILESMPAESGTYIGRLAEQERRFGNRRVARSISLAEAHEALSIRRFKQAADEYLRDKIEPTGYALKPHRKELKRTVCLLLSDLHLGAELSSLDEPMPYGAVQESRRLEFVLRQALDYKPQYRDQSTLLLILGGDMIDGLLLHDLRDGAPLTEQKVIFWRYMRAFLSYCSQQYPRVQVVCQPGNHGRDKVRHPGRATSRKWDGHEWELYYGLQCMCEGLKNVSFDIPFRAVSIVDLYGSKLLVTHGDTEVRLGDPDTKSTQNAQVLDQVNASRVYGVSFDAACFGHFHKPRYKPGHPDVIFNGALVPPNGYARTQGYIGEQCGQFLWESVSGFPMGDIRFARVGIEQDNDERLGELIKPFRFEE